jgi:hypothetical protein
MALSLASGDLLVIWFYGMTGHTAVTGFVTGV